MYNCDARQLASEPVISFLREYAESAEELQNEKNRLAKERKEAAKRYSRKTGRR